MFTVRLKTDFEEEIRPRHNNIYPMVACSARQSINRIAYHKRLYSEPTLPISAHKSEQEPAYEKIERLPSTQQQSLFKKEKLFARRTDRYYTQSHSPKQLRVRGQLLTATTAATAEDEAEYKNSLHRMQLIYQKELEEENEEFKKCFVDCDKSVLEESAISSRESICSDSVTFSKDRINIEIKSINQRPLTQPIANTLSQPVLSRQQEEKGDEQRCQSGGANNKRAQSRGAPFRISSFLLSEEPNSSGRSLTQKGLENINIEKILSSVVPNTSKDSFKEEKRRRLFEVDLSSIAPESRNSTLFERPEWGDIGMVECEALETDQDRQKYKKILKVRSHTTTESTEKLHKLEVPEAATAAAVEKALERFIEQKLEVVHLCKPDFHGIEESAEIEEKITLIQQRPKQLENFEATRMNEKREATLFSSYAESRLELRYRM